MPRKTAGELLRELEADPAWRAARDERERTLAGRAATVAADERELVAELRACGYDVDSVYDLVNNAPHPVLTRRFVGPYPAAYSVLIRHLDVQHVRAVREGVIRALTVRDGGRAVAAALLAAFQTETDPGMRWVFANALRVAMPYRERRRHPEIAAAYRDYKG